MKLKLGLFTYCDGQDWILVFGLQQKTHLYECRFIFLKNKKAKLSARLRVLFWGVGEMNWPINSNSAYVDLWIIISTCKWSWAVYLAELWFISVLDGRVERVKVEQAKSPGSLKWYFNFCCWLLIIWIIYVYKWYRSVYKVCRYFFLFLFIGGKLPYNWCREKLVLQILLYFQEKKGGGCFYWNCTKFLPTIYLVKYCR